MSGSRLGLDLARNLTEVTLEKCAQDGLENAGRNRPYSTRSVLDLSEAMGIEEGQSGIVIAAGPSLHRNDAARKIRDSGYTGILIATESAMSYCLRNGLVPHLVVTLDPHAKRIVRFFGDPDLSKEDLEADDYFRRQDLDPRFREDELCRNAELVDLVDRHGPKMKIAVGSCASWPVVKRCVGSGMELFWWNPLYDDHESPNSISRKVHQVNGLPCLNAGGNVGTACWVFAHSVLGLKEVALVGMDLSYYGDTDYSRTQYYHELVDLLGKERIAEAFITVENPYLDKTWFTDPTYYWYREIFLEMAAEAPCRTFNCTEGGILFGGGIDFIPLKQFLDTH